MSGLIQKAKGYWWAVRTTYKNLNNLHKGPEWVALKGLQDEADQLQRTVDKMVQRGQREVSSANAEVLRSMNQKLKENVRPDAWRSLADGVRARTAEMATLELTPEQLAAQAEEVKMQETAAAEMFHGLGRVSGDEAAAALERLRADGAMFEEPGEAAKFVEAAAPEDARK